VSDLHHPNKSLGQHWLTDSVILKQIVDEAGISQGERVVEIGPGTGTLTQSLLAAGAQVVAVEFDATLATALTKKFSDILVVSEDILTFDFTKVASPYKIVANIPYYLTSKLIRVLSESSNSPEIAVLLVQKEVAGRVCAEPGKMSLLSVSAQYYWQCELGIEVPAKFFTPPPKVDSQTVILTKRTNPLFGEIDERKLFRIVKAGFSNRRKTLLNSLSGGMQLSKDAIKTLLDTAKVNPQSRPQELSLQQWYDIYKVID
jgi:16S rRNA (adenine1518-N6/adenine1519-N6)-dimethyltransferase